MFAEDWCPVVCTAFILLFIIMAKRGKKFVAAKAQIEVGKKYPLAEAVKLAKAVSYAKFGWSMEVHIKTFADPKYNDQMIRATVVLPHGTGKEDNCCCVC